MTANDGLPVGAVIADYKRQIAELEQQLRDTRASLSSKLIVIESKQQSINRLANNNIDLMDKIEQLRNALIEIQQMADEDIQTGNAYKSSLYQIEADARAVLEKTGKTTP